MTRPLRLLVLLVAAACGPGEPPASLEQWRFAEKVPTQDGCRLSGSNTAPETFKWEKRPRVGGGFRWVALGQSSTPEPYVCELSGLNLACWARVRQWTDAKASVGLSSWLRGVLSADRLAFTGTVTVVGTCGEAVCPPSPGPPLPCLSELPVSGSALVEREPRACPPEGAKSEVGGAAATLTLRQASGRGALKLAALDALGGYTLKMPLDSGDRVVLQDYPTTVGTWWVLYEESAGTSACKGAFQIDGPEVQIVVKR